MSAIADGTWVIASGKLAKVHSAKRYGGADGYDIASPGKMYTNFAPDWCVTPAVIGVNVCDKPRGQCWCGYVHVHVTELAWLPVDGDDTKQDESDRELPGMWEAADFIGGATDAA